MQRRIFAAGLIACIATATQAGWRFTVQSAPHHHQDIWVAANGDNDEGWRSGGSICLRHGQGFGPGDTATLLTDVLSAGEYGPDGEPVPAFDANGDPIVYSAPSAEFGTREFTITPGETFFVIMDGDVVQSNIEGIEVGTVLPLMLTWDYELGYDIADMIAWTTDENGDWFPFLNEGPMMANVRASR